MKEIMSSFKKKLVYLIFGLILLVAFVMLLVFVITFWGPISNNLTDWYEYSAFLTFIVSLVNLACFVSLTYSASAFQEDSYHKQLLVQKIELETEFRKCHIEDIRKHMFELNQLPTMNMDSKESFREFMIRCKSMGRAFAIYATNNNNKLFGEADYDRINEDFTKLSDKLDEIFEKTSVPSRDDKHFFNEVLGDINDEIISLEKKLSDYTVQEMLNAFEDKI